MADDYDVGYGKPPRQHARFAQAKLTETLQGQDCEFDQTRIELVDVRHPILVLRGTHFMAHQRGLVKQCCPDIDVAGSVLDQYFAVSI